MKKVLIFTYLQRHLRKMIPLIEALNKDENIQLTVLLMTQEEKQIAESKGISYHMLDQYTDRKRSVDFDLGWGLVPLINALEMIKPDLFIAIEVNYILRNAIRYCKQKKIRNLVLQHGTPNEYSLHAFAPFEGECFAAWGEFSAQFLSRHYVDMNRIVVTGGIPFDRTFRLTPDKESIARELNLDPQKKWIVFATQPNGPGNRPTMQEIVFSIFETVYTLKNYPDVECIVQVHPHQSIQMIEKIVEQIPDHRALITKYHDTEKLIASSDGLITFFSTTAIDAVLLRKPLMLINLTDDREFFPFASMGVAQGIYRKEDIAPALENMLAGYDVPPEKYEEASKLMNGPNDGCALERVLDLCYQMLDGREVVK